MIFTWILFTLFSTAAVNEIEHELVIRITNIKNTEGKPLMIGVYAKTDAFPDYGKSSYSKKVLPKGNEVTVTFKLPAGEYAVGLMHDLNQNGKIDKNWVGYPTEPFGFSNNFKPKLGAPSFKDCSVDLRKGSQRIEIKLL
jgi:uncharacterized protein (DUF2141 family)